MGLKNKDGSLYKLRTPNPIMSEMSMWDKKDKLVIHNTCGKTIHYEDTVINPKTEVAELPEPEPVSRPVDKFDEIPIIESIDSPENSQSDIEKIQVWCQPVVDGELGKKFIFEAILEEEGDFQILLFTTTDAVTKGSVIFPKTYDKRWWLVSEVAKGEDGLTRVIGTITDYQPEFSSQ